MPKKRKRKLITNGALQGAVNKQGPEQVVERIKPNDYKFKWTPDNIPVDAGKDLKIHTKTTVKHQGDGTYLVKHTFSNKKRSRKKKDAPIEAVLAPAVVFHGEEPLHFNRGRLLSPDYTNSGNLTPEQIKVETKRIVRESLALEQNVPCDHIRKSNGQSLIQWMEHSNHQIKGVCGTCLEPFDTRNPAHLLLFQQNPSAARFMGHAQQEYHRTIYLRSLTGTIIAPTPWYQRIANDIFNFLDKIFKRADYYQHS